MFLHVVFVLAISFLWNEFRVNPWKFELISVGLLSVFSAILLISIVSTVR